jgi:hypothetical protein
MRAARPGCALIQSYHYPASSTASKVRFGPRLLYRGPVLEPYLRGVVCDRELYVYPIAVNL